MLESDIKLKENTLTL